MTLRTVARRNSHVSNLSPFTKLHVVISFDWDRIWLVVMFGLLAGQKLNLWSALFLISTVLTSVTDSSFRFTALRLRSSLELSRWSFCGRGRRRYAVTCWTLALDLCGVATIALYLNVFVLVVQLFQKVPALKAMAPTQSEPPFAVTQLVVLGCLSCSLSSPHQVRGEQLRGLSPPDNSSL